MVLAGGYLRRKAQLAVGTGEPGICRNVLIGDEVLHWIGGLRNRWIARQPPIDLVRLLSRNFKSRGHLPAAPGRR